MGGIERTPIINIKAAISDRKVDAGEAVKIVREARYQAKLPDAEGNPKALTPAVTKALIDAGIDPKEAAPDKVRLTLIRSASATIVPAVDGLHRSRLGPQGPAQARPLHSRTVQVVRSDLQTVGLSGKSHP